MYIVSVMGVAQGVRGIGETIMVDLLETKPFTVDKDIVGVNVAGKVVGWTSPTGQTVV